MIKRKRCLNLSIVVLAGLISLAFQWPWEQKAPAPKPKDEAAHTAPQESKPVIKAVQAKDSAPGESKPAEGAEAGEMTITEESTQSAGVGTNEIQRIQENMTRLAAQTGVIQTQSQVDRATLQNIIEQARIQRQLLDSLKVPVSNVAKDTANTEEILRATKLRLIAEDVRRTQESLRSFQSTAKATTIVTPVVKKVT